MRGWSCCLHQAAVNSCPFHYSIVTCEPAAISVDMLSCVSYYHQMAYHLYKMVALVGQGWAIVRCFPRPQIPRHQNSTPTSPPRLSNQITTQLAATSQLPCGTSLYCEVIHRAPKSSSASTNFSSEPKKLNPSGCSIRPIASLRTIIPPLRCPIPLGAFPVEKKEGKRDPIKHHACNISAPKAEQSLPCRKVPKASSTTALAEPPPTIQRADKRLRNYCTTLSTPAPAGSSRPV